MINSDQLSRRHYTRLRHYWRGQEKGGGSLADNIDLVLAGAGMIQRLPKDSSGVLRFAITPRGEVALAAEMQREVERRRPHHAFASRVSAWRRSQKRATWEGIHLLVESDLAKRDICPDVFSVLATYDAKRLAPLIDEIKVSRSDFLTDVRNPDKRAGYALVAEAVNYVVPTGLVSVSEVPPECGLIEEMEAGVFRILKQPAKQKVVLTAHTLMNLVLKRGHLPEIDLV